MSINGMKEPAATALEALRKAGISLCAETAEYLKIAEMSPTPMAATVDFPLILDALSKPEYGHLLKEAAAYASAQASSGESINSKEAIVNIAMNRLISLIGSEILRIIPGRVCLPLDPRLFVGICTTDSINTTAAVSRTSSTTRSTSSLLSTTSDSRAYSPEDLASALARTRALLLENETLDLVRTRVLVQIPSTPLGMAVAHTLETAGAHTMMTLVSGVLQAIGCAQAGASVISLAADGSRVVQRVVSDLAGFGYAERTEVMASGSSSLEGIMSHIPCGEGGAVGTAKGTISMIALAPGIIEYLHDTPPSNATSAVDGGLLAYTPDGATGASSLPEYFSSISGRTTADYATALAEDEITVEMLESGLQNHSMCAQMVEELLMAELDRVIAEALEGLALSAEDAIPSEDEDSDTPSASTTDFEDVDLHTPITNPIRASRSDDVPTQDITDTSDDRSITNIAPFADTSTSVGSVEDLPTPMAQEVSHSESVSVPISDREKSQMSVKARVMEIEARLNKDKQVEAFMAELSSDVSVHA